MDTALSQKFPFIIDRNLAKANCTENRVCTSCDAVVLVFRLHYAILNYLGTTLVEAKSGYGLNSQEEVRQLRVLRRASEKSDIEVVPTFLGAHAVPPYATLFI